MFDDDYPDEALGLRRHWLRGRINIALGHRERAAPDLGWATAGFAFFGYPFPAAVAALDYAERFLEAGFMNQARTLVQRAVDILEPLGLPRDTLISVLSLQRALETN